MKLKLILALFVLSLNLSACASQDSSRSIEVQCDAFYENPHLTDNLEVGVGEEFAVNLCSNGTTGFQWIEMADISDSGVLAQISHKYAGLSEKDDPPPPGTPGSQIWTFETLKAGTSKLSFEYSRDWEGGEKGAWTFVLTVKAK